VVVAVAPIVSSRQIISPTCSLTASLLSTRPQVATTPHKTRRHSKRLPLLSTHPQQHYNPHIAIPQVEAAMLEELQKTHRQFRNLEGLVLGLIREEYGNKKVK